MHEPTRVSGFWRRSEVELIYFRLVWSRFVLGTGRAPASNSQGFSASSQSVLGSETAGQKNRKQFYCPITPFTRTLPILMLFLLCCCLHSIAISHVAVPRLRVHSEIPQRLRSPRVCIAEFLHALIGQPRKSALNLPTLHIKAGIVNSVRQKLVSFHQGHFR